MKTLVITGGTSGLGLVTTRYFLQKGWKVLVLARNAEKAARIKENGGAAEMVFIPCDLSDLSSVHSAAKLVKANAAKIDVLLNNAGGIHEKRALTTDGYELTFQMNHLGHFLLTNLLLEKLMESKARVINVSSAAHKAGRLNFDDLNWGNRKYSSMRAYGDGKLCNIYFTREMHRRYYKQGISTFALHPGVVGTNFFTDLTGFNKVLVKFIEPFMKTPEQGARTQIYLAEAADIDSASGSYFVDRKKARLSGAAANDEKSRKLWEKSEEMTKSFMS